MDISPIVARLEAQLLPSLGWVAIGGAADLDAAIDNTAGTPAAYVLPLAERAGESYLAGMQAQPLLLTFAVCVCVQNVRDPRGAAAQSDLQLRRDQVKAALIGWTLSDAAVAYREGQLLRFDAGRLWWLDTYTTDAQVWAPVTS